jgi:hypothetical protein
MPLKNRYHDLPTRSACDHAGTEERESTSAAATTAGSSRTGSRQRAESRFRVTMRAKMLTVSEYPISYEEVVKDSKNVGLL